MKIRDAKPGTRVIIPLDNGTERTVEVVAQPADFRSGRTGVADPDTRETQTVRSDLEVKRAR